MKITFVQTGGTIDKEYPRGTNHHGYGFAIGESAVIPILKRANPSFEYEIVEAPKKDSLDITDEDRERIYAVVASIENDRIIVTHGTDTIRATAERLSGISGKTVILTGAMLPEKFYDSDAPFNIGVAVGAVTVLSHGVYIALGGRVVPWKEFQRT